MPTRHGSLLILAALLVVPGVAGCGSSGSSAHGSGSAGSASTHSAASGSSATSSHGSHKPCTLVNLKDADAALGLTLVATATNQDTGVSLNCVYNDNQGHRVQVAVSDAPETTQQLKTFSGHDGTLVPGIGDLAYWNLDQGTIYVVSHGVGFSVGVFDDHLTLGDAKLQAAASSLAKQAASRI